MIRNEIYPNMKIPFNFHFYKNKFPLKKIVIGNKNPLQFLKLSCSNIISKLREIVKKHFLNLVDYVINKISKLLKEFTPER